MRCGDCQRWLTERAIVYGDGSRVAGYQAPAGKGMCDHLNQETPEDFGCLAFAEGAEHTVVETKEGPPWAYWVMIPCPNCMGRGSDESACHRCAGTGKVRKYDDGYVGEEQTRLHPREKEAMAEQVRAAALARAEAEVSQLMNPAPVRPEFVSGSNA